MDGRHEMRAPPRRRAGGREVGVLQAGERARGRMEREEDGKLNVGRSGLNS